MPLVGAVALPHSHLQLFTRPAESERYRHDVQRGREALFVLREHVDRLGADTILLIHDDHFVNFDFRCYPPFALFVGRDLKGSGVMDPVEIEKITGAIWQPAPGSTDYASAPKGIPQHMANWAEHKPYVYQANFELSSKLLTGLMERDFDIPFTANGTMDGELVLTTNFLNPAADKSMVLLLTNGYVPPLPFPRRCFALGRAIREIIDASASRVLVMATGGMSHYPGTPLYGEVDEAFDRHLLSLFATGDVEALQRLTPAEMLHHGNGELVNWIIAAGIVGARPATIIDYVRLWHIGLGYFHWEL